MPLVECPSFCKGKSVCGAIEFINGKQYCDFDVYKRGGRSSSGHFLAQPDGCKIAEQERVRQQQARSASEQAQVSHMLQEILSRR